MEMVIKDKDVGAINVDFNEMINFLNEFDSIQLKYGLTNGIRSNRITKIELDKYQELEKMEDISQHSDLTKITYDESRKNLDMIYDNKELSENIIKIYDLIKNKIIFQYINIDGLERLFSEKYIEFEWEMHLGIDYKHHKMDFYRDHFVHQMRNVYCLDVFLRSRENKGLGWYHYVEEVLKNPANSKVSRYVYKSVEQQKKLKIVSDEYNVDEFFYRNIIYMACYMAALFHDIGYPEVSNSQNQKRIIDYIANLYNVESSGYNYERLRALLQNTLLFRVVPFEEIQGRMIGIKPDHGVISAIIFLMNFYENGAIQRLEPYKRCAVELAALAMYNHTNKYSYKKKVMENGYVRASFLANPISYLLRLCDDLQEWGRVYFELSHASNLIICNQCKTPVIKKYDENAGNYFYACNCNRGKEDKNGIFSPVFDYRRNFPYRRIYNVCVCDNLYLGTMIDKISRREQVIFQLDYKLDKLLHVAYINSSFAMYRSQELKKLKNLLDFQFNLPPMYLTYFVSANPILIKTYILYQYFCFEKKSELYDLQESWCKVVSNNQAIIKLINNLEKQGRVTEDDTYENKLQNWSKDFSEDYYDIKYAYEDIIFFLKKLVKSKVDDIYGECNKTVNADKLNMNVKDVVNDCVELYVKLLVYMHLCKEINHYKMRKEFMVVLCKFNQMVMDLEMSHYPDSDLQQLIIDAMEQSRKLYKVPDFGKLIIHANEGDISKNSNRFVMDHDFDLGKKPELYYEQFISSEYTYGCIKRFVDVDRYKPVSWLKKPKNSEYYYIDAFTDLKFFKCILAEIYKS